MTDPIATLRGWFGIRAPNAALNEALAEIERRAHIEARRDAHALPLQHVPPSDTGAHRVSVMYARGHRAVWGPECTGPDYHTALEAALNAAGAP